VAFRKPRTPTPQSSEDISRPVLAGILGLEEQFGIAMDHATYKQVLAMLKTIYTDVGVRAYMEGRSGKPYDDPDIQEAVSRYPMNDERVSYVVGYYVYGFKSAQMSW
jgi:hypothetical protein